MEELKYDIIEEQRRILDFWLRMKDEECGGFYCNMDYNFAINKKADKSGISIARNLWTFSKAYNTVSSEEYLNAAKHAYDFLVNNLLDKENRGAYWLLDYMGRPVDKRKHIYLQAFCIYALSEYYIASKNDNAKAIAMDIYSIIETIGYDKVRDSYKEEFSVDWQEKDNRLLSENSIIADITTNTHLHILEAYTNLYMVEPSDKIRKSLEHLVEIFYKRIYSHEEYYNKVFFNTSWEEVLNLRSFGHDIEASWLIDEALKILDTYDEKYDRMVIKLAEEVLNTAVLYDGSVANECENSIIDESKIWWVQAEAAVGFYNAYKKTGEQKYHIAFINVWNYIKKYITDERKDGEWLCGRNSDNSPDKGNIVGLWKVSYHNSRCCFELNKRIFNGNY